MRKIFTLYLFYSCLYHEASAQREIELNFQTYATPDFKDIDTFQQGDFYRIKITGINQNLYKVTLNNTDTTVSKALEMPTFASLSLDAVKSAIAGISPVTAFFKNAADENENERMEILETNPVRNVQVKVSIGEKMADYRSEMAKLAERLDKIRMDIDKIYLQANTAILNRMKLIPVAATYNSITAVQDIGTARVALVTLRKDIATLQSNYLQFSESKKAEIEKTTPEWVRDNLKTTDTEIRLAFTQLVKAGDELQTGVSADKVKELISSMVVSENNESTEYNSMPLQFTKEQTRIDIKIEPRASELKLQTYTTSIVFPARRRGYAGVGISFYYAGLHDKPYSISGIPINDSTTHYQAKAENVKKVEVGIAALMRFGTKIKGCESFGIHSSVGPGVSITDKVKPRVLAGGGISIGKTHMFTADFGGIFGYVDRLSSAYDETTMLKENPERVTVSRFDSSWFVSVGYLYRF